MAQVRKLETYQAQFDSQCYFSGFILLDAKNRQLAQVGHCNRYHFKCTDEILPEERICGMKSSLQNGTDHHCSQLIICKTKKRLIKDDEDSADGTEESDSDNDLDHVQESTPLQKAINKTQ